MTTSAFQLWTIADLFKKWTILDSSSCRNVLIMNLVNIVNRTGKSSLEKFFFKRPFGNPDLTTSVFQIWTDTDKSSPFFLISP